jgi:hypothetical protein
MSSQLQQTHDAVLSADNARLHDAIGSVTWERRGILQRLVRIRSVVEDDAKERKRGT